MQNWIAKVVMVCFKIKTFKTPDRLVLQFFKFQDPFAGREGFVSDIQDFTAGLSYVIDKVKGIGDILNQEPICWTRRICLWYPRPVC